MNRPNYLGNLTFESQSHYIINLLFPHYLKYPIEFFLFGQVYNMYLQILDPYLLDLNLHNQNHLHPSIC